MVENDEPAAWTEELIEPARAVDHPRLAALYVMASQCYTTGRIDEAVQYCDAGQIVLARSRDTLPYGLEGVLGGAYLFSGQAERWVEVCRARLQRRRNTNLHVQACLAWALVFAGSGEEAIVAAGGLIESAEPTRNPFLLSYALGAYGFAFRDADPIRALDAFGRGLAITQDSTSDALTG
jgi:hypothetical protein